MPFARQRRAVPHCRTALQTLTVCQTLPMNVTEPVVDTVGTQAVVPGFRYLLRSSVSSSLAPLTALALSAAFFAGTPAQAKSKSSRYSKSSNYRKSKASKLKGVWAWTAGTMTYLRARPGIQTPPVAKVPRHTKLMVWGKYDGWYRVETTDGKFGWIRNELLSSPGLEKVAELSHSKARRASDRTSNQVMYGSAEELKKHYQRFGAPGAKKGLAALGIKVSPKSSAKSAQRLALQKAARQKATQDKIVQAKITRQIAQQKAAQAKASQLKWAAAKVAQEKAARTKLAMAKAAAYKAAAYKAEQARATQARLIAARAEQAKIAQAKAAQVKAAQAKAAQAKAAQAKAMQAKIAVRPTPATPVKTLMTIPSQPPMQAKPTPALVQTVPAVKALSGTPLQPVLPNPTTNTPVKVITPAIPIPPKNSSQTARKGNYQPPSISAEDLMRAREEHLKRRSSVPAPAVNAQKSQEMAFVPQAYYLSSAVYAPSMARGKSLPAGQFTPRLEETGPKPLFVPLERSLPALHPAVSAVIMAKNVAKPVAKATPTVTAKTTAKVGPSRGGSPRDYARVASNSFGQGVATQALSYRGRPYIRGAASPSRGFDCSGLVYFLLRQRGYNPPRTAAGLARYGKPVPPGQLKAGDLVLFANTYKRGVSHVGIYAGNNNFVHAATSGTGVRVDSLGSAYYCRKYWGARRVEPKK